MTRASAPPRTQCLDVAFIALALCSSSCSSERLTNANAFAPPSPASYVVVERRAKENDEGDETRDARDEARDDERRAFVERRADGLRAVANVDRVPPTHVSSFQRVLDDFEIARVRTSRGNAIVVMTCEGARLRNDGADVTMIVSHGNAVDAGEFAPFARKLAHTLRCRVVVYDYSGYGQSTGRASVKDTYADIEAVVAHVATRHDVGMGEIVLYGQSIGSGPVCDFASKKRTNDVGAVVLVSPLLSALNVLSAPNAWCTPAKVYKRMDVYKNYAVVKTIRAPILVIHGDHDRVVHQSHGRALWEEICKRARDPNDVVFDPYWIPGAGHDDTYDKNPAEFIRHLKNVCEVVRERCNDRGR